MTALLNHFSTSQGSEYVTLKGLINETGDFYTTIDDYMSQLGNLTLENNQIMQELAELNSTIQCLGQAKCITGVSGQNAHVRVKKACFGPDSAGFRPGNAGF